MRYLKKLNISDALATLVLAAIAVPYIGYVVRGSMPFIRDARDMAETGLLLGVVAWMAVSLARRPTRYEFALASVALVMGFITLGLAATFASEVLLAVFMGSILAVWSEALLRDSGLLHLRHPHPRR